MGLFCPSAIAVYKSKNHTHRCVEFTIQNMAKSGWDTYVPFEPKIDVLGPPKKLADFAPDITMLFSPQCFLQCRVHSVTLVLY